MQNVIYNNIIGTYNIVYIIYFQMGIEISRPNHDRLSTFNLSVHKIQIYYWHVKINNNVPIYLFQTLYLNKEKRRFIYQFM